MNVASSHPPGHATDLIRDIHATSRGTYGAPRVHAELRIGREIVVGRHLVARLMHRAGLVGLPLRRRFRRTPGQKITSADLVDRCFEREGPDQLWVTDIERHEALSNRAAVRGHGLRLVAAGRVKLRAA